MDHRYWLGVASLLARDISVMFLDQRGSGSSMDSTTPAPTGSDLCAVLAAVGADATVLVAQDRDMASTLAAALEAPERVGHVVALDPLLSEFMDKDSPWKLDAAVEIGRRRLKENMARSVVAAAPLGQAVVLAVEGEDGTEEVRSFVDSQYSGSSDVTKTLLADMLWSQLRNHRGRQRTTFPVVVGRLAEIEAAVTMGRIEKDALLDLVADELSRRLPRATVVRLEYGPPPVSLEAPEGVARLISEAIEA